MADALYRGQVLSGGFRLLEPIGEGAFSWVWLAEEVGTGRRFALKVARSEDHLPILRRQAETPAHPHIAEVFSVQDHEPPYYLVMEAIDGASLRAVLDQCPKGLKLGAALRLFRQILLAVLAAHDDRRVHGDLKPENVLITRDRRVKVTDFGAVAGFEDASLRHSLVTGRSTRAGAPLAAFTPLYLAPELRGAGAVCTRAGDLYALGIILHELVTGRAPQGADLPSVLRPSLPRWVDEAFQWTFTAEERRVGSVAELLDFIDREVERQAERDARRPGSPEASGAELEVPRRRPPARTPRGRPRASGPTPGLVVAGFILAFCCPLLGLIFCELGKREALASGRGGVSLANAGIAVSLVLLALQALALITGCGAEGVVAALEVAGARGAHLLDPLAAHA